MLYSVRGEKMKNKLIIFDCFGVIFNEVAPVFLRRHLPAEKADEIKDKLFIPADLGLVTHEELLQNMAYEIGIPLEEVKTEWEALFIIKKDTVSAIKELHKKNDIALLSNAPLGVVEALIEKHSLSSLFDNILISCNIGLAKPDPEIYLHCVSLFDKEYDEIYMIDDSAKNLEVLPSIGIRPVLFRTVDDLECLLK